MGRRDMRGMSRLRRIILIGSEKAAKVAAVGVFLENLSRSGGFFNRIGKEVFMEIAG